MHRRWKKVVAYLKNSHELITIAIFYFAITGIRLGRPDVEVTYELQNLAPAAGLSREIERTSLQAPSNLTHAATKLMQSTDLLRIELVNNTHNRIGDLEINVLGVSEAIDTAVLSSSRTMNRDARTLAAFVTNNDVVTFTNLKSLPPRAHVTVLLWGKIPLPVFGDSVQVIAAAPTVDVAQRSAVAGIRLFVARNIGLITFLLVAYFLIIALRRMRQENTENAANT